MHLYTKPNDFNPQVGGLVANTNKPFTVQRPRLQNGIKKNSNALGALQHKVAHTNTGFHSQIPLRLETACYRETQNTHKLNSNRGNTYVR